MTVSALSAVLGFTPGDLSMYVYSLLPEVYRDVDPANGLTMLRYISTLGDRAGAVQEMYQRLNFVQADERDLDPFSSGTSDLVDPTTADPAWLPWLAQLLGGDLDLSLPIEDQRDAVRFASNGWRGGSTRAITDAARSALTGTKYARVIPHHDANGPNSIWHILIITRTSETASVSAVLQAVLSKGVKPAGVVLHHAGFETTWGLLEDNGVFTWADAERYVDWGTAEEIGAPAEG